MRLLKDIKGTRTREANTEARKSKSGTRMSMSGQYFYIIKDSIFLVHACSQSFQ